MLIPTIQENLKFEMQLEFYFSLFSVTSFMLFCLLLINSSNWWNPIRCYSAHIRILVTVLPPISNWGCLCQRSLFTALCENFNPFLNTYTCVKGVPRPDTIWMYGTTLFKGIRMQINDKWPVTQRFESWLGVRAGELREGAMLTTLSPSFEWSALTRSKV